MLRRIGWCRAVAALALLWLPRSAPAQDSRPVQRVANIVAVAVDEYGKGIDATGRIVAAEEYQEAIDFLTEARTSAARLPTERAAPTLALLDSIIAAVNDKQPPATLGALSDRLIAVLGSGAALERPSRPPDMAEGQAVYQASCASCHGPAGMGDGPAGVGLDPPPPAIGSAATMGAVSSAMMYRKIAVGVAGTAMPSFETTLTSDQRWSVVAYLDSLQRASARGAGAWAVARAASRHSLSLLEQSVAAARAGQRDDASDRALDAYLAFEPVETPARARNPGVVSSMERLYTDFRAAIQGNDLRGADRARGAIEAAMPAVVDLVRPAGNGTEAFFQSFLIILREGLEAILVIGAVVAFLLKTGHRERLRSIWMGVGLGLAASGVTAVVLRTALQAIPASQEIIEGVTLLAAVVVLFSVSYWLISRVEAARWQRFIREKVTAALDRGGGRALAFVAFLAVYREGAETALFYQALFSEGARVALPIALGIIAGFAALAVVFTLFYRYGVRIPLRPFFGVTSVLLYYMAFVFTGTGVRELQEGGVVPITPIRGLPSVGAIGFSPTWETALAQLLLLALFAFAVARTFWPRRPAQAPASGSAPDPSGPALEPELRRLESENAELAARVAALASDQARLRDRLAALEGGSRGGASAGGVRPEAGQQVR